MKTAKLSALLAIHLLVYTAVGLEALRVNPVAALPFGGLLIWVSVHDIRRFQIPDIAVVLLVATGLVQSLKWPKTTMLDTVAGGVIWPALFWIVARGYREIRSRHGLGFGDVKLMAGIGLWCGFLGGITVVLAAALSGLAVLVILHLLNLLWRDAKHPLGRSAVAFGPFLCLSAWYVWNKGMGI